MSMMIKQSALLRLVVVAWCILGQICHAQTSPAPANEAKQVCKNFRTLLDMPIGGCDAPVEGKNFSTDPHYAEQSAFLVQETLGQKIDFIEFQHLPFTIRTVDRTIKGNLFVFQFKDSKQLEQFVARLPKEAIGARGMLTAEAPQQFEILAIDATLAMLVIDGSYRNNVVDELYARFRRLKYDGNHGEQRQP